ncbi:hypothetical protein P9D34_14235 [Bacillus swezeyi]|uniref:hypothetical protein n=1 Tax=Bacillus swezeyi TaxID=1925020 RepID=UPI0009756DC2|nr:hypothetical protein [Bacillus swezeyi]MEC1261592.1 hypothetical protein [Bacillus swezeyi]MED2926545.1 hypothetical protein [Bacillus swezeyi]MED3070704.1 hypothetical protein [Bacillus swezeyi]MED3082364.1 hypothetical protein [Bacillus swezeyi]
MIKKAADHGKKPIVTEVAVEDRDCGNRIFLNRQACKASVSNRADLENDGGIWIRRLGSLHAQVGFQNIKVKKAAQHRNRF